MGRLFLGRVEGGGWGNLKGSLGCVSGRWEEGGGAGVWGGFLLYYGLGWGLRFLYGRDLGVLAVEGVL